MTLIDWKDKRNNRIIFSRYGQVILYSVCVYLIISFGEWLGFVVDVHCSKLLYNIKSHSVVLTNEIVKWLSCVWSQLKAILSLLIDSIWSHYWLPIFNLFALSCGMMPSNVFKTQCNIRKCIDLNYQAITMTHFKQKWIIHAYSCHLIL
jgi:hypothetical protein